ncbi:MAG: flagellar biosynthetic protein FliR [Rhodobacterales bacterium]|nr:flagellar biosynthetic protein FliR [Rhodobacterales bacterium]MDX5500997.1 flagellar biosynthetic protein FliR [Rhodobacterales bacterium]
MIGLGAVLDWLEGDGLALFWGGFLCFVRTGAVMALLPAFGEQSVPARFRLGLALALTLAVAPAVASPMPITPAAILAEALAGLALGAGFRLFVIALQTAGAMAAQATSLSQIFASAGAEPQSAISALLTMAALSLAFTMGLHVRAAEALILSYNVLPLGQFPAAPDMTEWGLAQISHSFALAFSLAAPFLIGGLLYNAALGVINRAMPTLMVSFVGAPALTFGGLVLLAIAAPLMLAVWLSGWSAWLADPFSIPR